MSFFISFVSLISLSFGLGIMGNSQAMAFDLPGIQNLQVDSPLQLQGNYDFEGIVALGNCSASLIRFETSRDSDAALVMTNGHCVEAGPIPNGKFIYKKPSTRPMTLLNTNASNAGRIRATELVYATMTGTDIAIYKTKESFGEIESQFKIRALTLSSRHPELNSPIEILSGFWKKGYACAIEAFVPELKEASWVMKDSVRFSRPGCETIGGTSGSPILAAGSRTVVAINNTGNEDGDKCTMNNPCEVDGSGNITYQKGYSYGQQTYWVYSCLNSESEFDLETPGCTLPH